MRKISICLLCLCLFSSLLAAQRGFAGCDRKVMGYFLEQGEEVTTASAPLSLIVDSNVLKVLHLNEVQLKQISTLLENYAADRRQLYAKEEIMTGEQRLVIDQRLKDGVIINVFALLDNKQILRMVEIQLQVQDGFALLQPDIQRRLQLSETQTNAVYKALQERDSDYAKLADIMSSSRLTQKGLYDLQHSYWQKSNDRFLHILQPAQAKVLRDLQGNALCW